MASSSDRKGRLPMPVTAPANSRGKAPEPWRDGDSAGYVRPAEVIDTQLNRLRQCWFRDVSLRRSGIVVEIRTEPPLDFGYTHIFSLAVVEHLIAFQLPQNEIAGLGMREIHSTDAGARPHSEGFRNLHPCFGFDIKKPPDRALFRVVRALGIARGWSDSLILLVNQIFVEIGRASCRE